MRLALAEAEKNLSNLAGGPFGACIVRHGEVLALARNTVLAEQDPTCHAEINAIRAASRLLGAHRLSGCQLYSTTEPCPMCFAAIHWAGIEQIIYGSRIRDVQRLGFNELALGNRQMQRLGHSPVIVRGAFLRHECLGLLRKWAALADRPVY
jgi:guanine deaminase